MFRIKNTKFSHADHKYSENDGQLGNLGFNMEMKRVRDERSRGVKLPKVESETRKVLREPRDKIVKELPKQTENEQKKESHNVRFLYSSKPPKVGLESKQKNSQTKPEIANKVLGNSLGYKKTHQNLRNNVLKAAPQFENNNKSKMPQGRPLSRNRISKNCKKEENPRKELKNIGKDIENPENQKISNMEKKLNFLEPQKTPEEKLQRPLENSQKVEKSHENSVENSTKIQIQNKNQQNDTLFNGKVQENESSNKNYVNFEGKEKKENNENEEKLRKEKENEEMQIQRQRKEKEEKEKEEKERKDKEEKERKENEERQRKQEEMEKREKEEKEKQEKEVESLRQRIFERKRRQEEQRSKSKEYAERFNSALEKFENKKIKGMLTLNDPLSHFEFDDVVMDVQIYNVLKLDASKFPSSHKIQKLQEELSRINSSYMLIKDDPEQRRLCEGLKGYRIELFNKIGEAIVEDKKNGFVDPEFSVAEAPNAEINDEVKVLRGVPQNKISSVVSEVMSTDDIECQICLETIKLGEMCHKLPCRHIFHIHCLTDWIKNTGNCPTCRKNLKQ